MVEPSSALAPLRAEEISAARELLVHSGLLTDTTHVAYLGLVEPDKRLDGEAVPRRFRAMLIDMGDGTSHDVVVCPIEDRVVSSTRIEPARDGQVPVVMLEFAMVEEIVHKDPRWLAAMHRRGLTDLSVLRVQPLSAGAAMTESERGRRLQRTFTFLQKHPQDLPWAHPVDGVVAYVDVIAREVVDVVDAALLAVPQEDGNFHLAEFNGPTREGFRPIEITQPHGPSFTIDADNVLEWLGWKLQVSFDSREGLVLRDISIAERPVLYRASIAEMVVPYADPSPQRWFQTFFDGGEYLLGNFANSLELGCDCVGDITYLDVVVADNAGQPRTIPQAICIHEEDAGVLWKHTSSFTGSSDVRRNRRLVVSFFVTVGNYDYGFYWYFYLDGTIELEVKATGVVFTSGHPGGDYAYATEVAPALGAPHHQHLFSARLDFTVDGPANYVEEVDAVAVPRGPENPTGTGITQQVTRLRRESDAPRLADGNRGRVWRIGNPSVQNRLGRDVAYVLHPQGQPALLADASSDLYGRATFATGHLWVTAYDPAEQYPAGDFVNQHPGGAGIPAWIAADRDVDGTDIVVWHTFGLTHFPRPEDWPVMPVDTTGFVLKPAGFFGRNPTLDVPASGGNHCHA
ncbi:amine oxidase [Asanoa ishikariensis]|uniref:Amine oxidase n=1 Tax=Asanoa ishikariensis TaxID=137265 RepID=A0A1H3UP46_9ACTN|nr:primary-amine oxidase [Asanoa ishikariensis]GIF69923.1 amine oxidase [Asanoa ishikariensis]SDZ63509.1 primary-amine oxidase [Asanoa ishikariensis]